jgi:hypothetical protein
MSNATECFRPDFTGPTSAAPLVPLVPLVDQRPPEPVILDRVIRLRVRRVEEERDHVVTARTRIVTASSTADRDTISPPPSVLEVQHVCMNPSEMRHPRAARCRPRTSSHPRTWTIVSPSSSARSRRLFRTGHRPSGLDPSVLGAGDLVVPLAPRLARRVVRVQDRLHDAAVRARIQPRRVPRDGPDHARGRVGRQRGTRGRLEAVQQHAVLAAVASSPCVDSHASRARSATESRPGRKALKMSRMRAGAPTSAFAALPSIAPAMSCPPFADTQFCVSRGRSASDDHPRSRAPTRSRPRSGAGHRPTRRSACRSGCRSAARLLRDQRREQLHRVLRLVLRHGQDLRPRVRLVMTDRAVAVPMVEHDVRVQRRRRDGRASRVFAPPLSRCSIAEWYRWSPAESTA